MRLVNKTEFLKLPEGTMYFEYVRDANGRECAWFGNLCVKGESLEKSGDFFYRDLQSPALFFGEANLEIFFALDIMKEGHSCSADFDYEGRDGFYDDTHKYWVLEKTDVESLFCVIGKAYQDAYIEKD